MKFLWTRINVKDLDESIEFYTGVVGLAVNRRINPGPGIRFIYIGDPNGVKIQFVENVGG